MDLFLVHLPQPEAESQVFIDRDVGIQRVVLENHGDIPVLWFHVVDDAVVDLQRAAGDILQACDHAQGSGLAATGGPDEDHEFLVFDLQVKIMDRNDVFVVNFFNMLKRYTCHVCIPPSISLLPRRR